MRLDHVQLAMPAGGEDVATAFYEGVLRIPRVAKPSALAARGGCWFEDGLGLRVHLGVEEGFRPARKAHPALEVDDWPSLRGRLEAAGAEIRAGDGPGQFYVDDPFGNRIELIDPSADPRS